jgi:diaminohydroxyphosphoribosylaminopyrimidine deaminase / 5-amino-6-(5-phosphoribosylamino)uracil reductase
MNPDERFMRRAIELSGNGYPAPNPHVGCVIVQGGEVVGEGFHDHAGGPHAEAVALTEAGEKAKGAEVYVTLEPCNHTGRTPPCSQALIQAGVASVTVACGDPNPRAIGGVNALRKSGIYVTEGVMTEESRSVNERWLTAVERRSPFVEVKVAMSLDGRVALPNGESQWITNERSREEGHELRAQCGAVLVGRNTVTRDNPHLTARIPSVVNQPVRIVLDPNSALTRLENVFSSGAPAWHVVKHPIHADQMHAPMQGDAIDLGELLKEFYARGVIGILVEGGPNTIAHFLRAGLVDRLNIFMAPVALGDGLSWLKHETLTLADANRFTLEQVKELDGDLWMTYRPLA